MARTTRTPALEPAMINAALYLRISDDREGRELGVDRQEEDCRRLAERLGVRLFRIYRDNDIGASTRSKKPRPDYKRMIADAAAGKVTMIIAYTSGRLTRRPLELEGQIRLAEDHGTTFRYVASPDFDLNTSAGRRVARILAANDAGEAEDIAERVARARRQQAEQGRFGGGRRPYGFDVDGVTPIEAEWEVIRQAATAVLKGIGLRGFAKTLNDRGVPTATGRAWSSPTLRDILLRPRNAGHMVHQGEVIEGMAPWSSKPRSTDDPTPWGDILSDDVWKAVVAKLTDPDRVTAIPGRAVVKYLGSGIYTCHCGQVVNVRAGYGNKAAAYRCRKDGIGGKHVLRAIEAVDRIVVKLAIGYVTRPDVRAIFDRPEGGGVDLAALRSEVAALRQRKTDLAELFAEGTIQRPALVAGTRKLDEQLAEAQATLDAHTDVNPAAELANAADPAALWLTLPLATQRAIVKKLMTVTIKPAQSRVFRPEDVEITWND